MPNSAKKKKVKSWAAAADVTKGPWPTPPLSAAQCLTVWVAASVPPFISSCLVYAFLTCSKDGMTEGEARENKLMCSQITMLLSWYASLHYRLSMTAIH